MPTRQHRDPSGTEWEVFEVHRLNDRPNSVRPALESGWLAFVSEREKRRLPEYPADWMELSDAELQKLLISALVAADLTPSSARTSGPVPAPVLDAAEQPVEPRRYPRLTPRSLRTVLPEHLAPPEPDSTSVSTPAAALGGLPVPPLPTMSGTLGRVGIDALVRAHARRARENGVAVIEGMIGVKRALADAGEEVSPESIRLLRKVFVDEYYFSR